MSYSPPKPTVFPFIRVIGNFSVMTIRPLYVSVPRAPVVTGTVASGLPSRTTRMVCAVASTRLTWLRPTVKCTFLRWIPYIPRAPRTSRSRRSSVTRVPGRQYVRGRKSSRVGPNQWPEISAGGEAVTWTARSTAARSAIGRSKAKETIIPVPTTDSGSGEKYPTKRCSGTYVLKPACRTVRRPAASSATTSTR